MNLSNETIGVLILCLLITITFLIRCILIGRTDMRNTRTRLLEIEEEIHRHPLTCPLKQQVEKQAAILVNRQTSPITEYLKSRLLTNEEEAIFRSVFTSKHPNILQHLHSICPRATRADELLCMLIHLRQSNEEISYLLGISRASVLKNRYRLRCKLKLPEGIDLDAEIRKMLTE